MKTIIPTLLSIIIICSACQSQSQKQDFKYKGELPGYPFVIYDFDKVDITHNDTIPLRNRVYIGINEKHEFLLNGHVVDSLELNSALSYIVKNPDQLTHLPSKKENVVFYLNIEPANDLFDKKYTEHLSKLSKIVSGFLKKEILDFCMTNFSKKPEELNEEEQIILTEEMMPRIAIPPIEEDKGIRVELPSWSEEETDITKLKKRNVLDVLVNDKNEILIRGKQVKVDEVTNLAKIFISNPRQDENLAETPRKAIISLKNDRGTNYKTYLSVYTALKAAYNELWDIEANKLFKKSYKALTTKEKKAVRSNIPLVLSEAEPTGFGSE